MIVGVTEREETDGLLVRFRLSQKYNEREPSEVELRMRDMICLHTRRRYFWGSSKDDALLKRDVRWLSNRYAYLTLENKNERCN